MMKLSLLSAALAVASATCAHAADIKTINSDAWFAEGPIWYQNQLYYVEYGRGTVMTWDGKENHVFWKQDGCGPSAVVPTKSGEFVVTCYDSNSIGRISAAPAAKSASPLVSIERVRISQLAGEGRLTSRSGPASVPQRNRVVGLLPLQVLNRTLHWCLPRHESDASAPAIVDRTMFVSALPSASGHAPTAERSGLAAQSPARAHRAGRARSSHGPVLKDPQRDADDEHDPAHHEPNREHVRRQDRNPPHDTLRTTSA